MQQSSIGATEKGSAVPLGILMASRAGVHPLEVTHGAEYEGCERDGKFGCGGKR